MSPRWAAREWPANPIGNSYGRSAPLTLATSAINLVSAVLAGMIVARVLGPSGKGDLARLVVFSSLAFDLAALGVAEAIVYSIAQAPNNRLQVMRFLLVPTRLQGVVGVGIYLVLVLLAGVLDLGVTVPIIAFGIWIPLAIYMTRSKSYLLGRGSFRAFNTTRLISEASPVAFIAILAIARDLTLSTTALSYLLAISIAAWFAGRAVRVDLVTAPRDFKLAGTTISNFWSYARRNFVSVIASRGNATVDILLLSLLATPSAGLGAYAVAGTAGISIAIIGISLGMLTFSRVSGLRQGTSPWPVLFPLLASATCITALATVVVWVLAPVLIPIIYGDAFSASIPLTRILVIGGFCVSVSHVFGAALKGMDRPGAVALAEVAGVLTTVFAILFVGTDSLEWVASSAVAGFGMTLLFELGLTTHHLKRLASVHS